METKHTVPSKGIAPVCHRATLLLGMFFSACAGNPNQAICDEAAQKFDSCGIEVTAQLMDACTEQSAKTVLAASCDALQDNKDEKKADAWGTPLGGDCAFNYQCDGPLVCRPHGFTNLLSDYASCFSFYCGCQVMGGLYASCDSNSDCNTGWCTPATRGTLPKICTKVCSSDADCASDSVPAGISGECFDGICQ